MPTQPQNALYVEKLSAYFADKSFRENYYELSEHWRQILSRAQIYNGLDAYHSFTKSWSQNKNTCWRLKEIARGIEALQELEPLKLEFKQDLQWDIRCAIDAELSFLELRQYRKLIIDQEIYRPEVLVLYQSLQKKVDQTRKRMQERKYSEGFTIPSTKAIYHFLKNHEKPYFDFDKAITTSGLTGDIIGTGSSSITISRFIPLSFVKLINPKILFTIPAISGIVAAIPLLFGTLKSYFDNRKPIVKFFNTLLAIVVFTGIGIAISMPFTVPAISGIFVAGGIVKDYFKPLYDLFKNIRHKNKLKEGLAQNNYILKNTNERYIALNKINKTTLYQSLEKYCAKNEVPPEEIEIARALITNSKNNLYTLIANPLIAATTQCKSAKELRSYLGKQTQRQIEHLGAEIKLLESQRFRMTALSVNGMLTIAGLILFCIPTPTTMLAGACVIGISYAINLVVKYELIQKSYNFLKNTFAEEQCTKQLSFKFNRTMNHLHRRLYAEFESPKCKEDNIEIEIGCGIRPSTVERVQDIIEPPTTPRLTRAAI